MIRQLRYICFAAQTILEDSVCFSPARSYVAQRRYSSNGKISIASIEPGQTHKRNAIFAKIFCEDPWTFAEINYFFKRSLNPNVTRHNQVP